MDRFTLFSIIDKGFDTAELKVLCFELGVDYDSIGSGPKPQWIIELIGYFDRRGELDRLERICRMLRPIWFPTSAQPAQYRFSIAFPLDTIRESLKAISKLTLPSTWRDLAITRPLTHGGWMGSNSDTTISILYTLYRPIITYYLIRSDVERNFYLLDWRSRLKFQFLEFVMQTVTHDAIIASVPPKMDYTPRGRGWRQQRELQPAKYWWQGLSQDRLDKAVDGFCRIEPGGQKRILSFPEFQQYYQSLFSSNDEAAQQAIGLAANPLYGFSLATRPVYWRALIIQSMLYWTILYIQDESLRQPETDADLLNCVTTAILRDYPFRNIDNTMDTYETQDTTLQASLDFIRLIVVPNVFLKLSASQYQEPSDPNTTVS